jgi:hypothetical protein
MLAKAFSPLFLVMVVAYLVTMLVLGKSPYMDRPFLIVFNGLLLLVLGLAVFSVVRRPANSPVGVVDYINLSLILVTLVIDVVALSAIAFRVISDGLTPNRAAVLGANLIVFVHLLLIARAYFVAMLARRAFAEIGAAIANFLPVYCIWVTLVALGLPLVFGFA